MRQFDTKRRGHTLFQFCRDEGVDYKSLMAYKRSAEPKGKCTKKQRHPAPDSQNPYCHTLPAHAAAGRSGTGHSQYRMNSTYSDIDPRLDALTAEGKAEYLRCSETFHRLTSSHLANVKRLKEIRRLDPGHAAIYDWKIDSLLKEAAEVMEQWHGHRRKILEKWLPEH